MVGVLVVAGAVALGTWWYRSLGASDTVVGPVIVSEPAPGEPVAVDEPLAATGGAVDVQVTFWGWDDDAQVVEVGGFVSGVVESGGSCLLTLSHDGRTVTVEAEGRPDATTTSCGALTVDGDRLEPGTWTAVLTYSSATSSGAADEREIEVQGR